MTIYFVGKAKEVSANLKQIADSNRLLTAEQYIQSLAREKRAKTALAGLYKTDNVAGGGNVRI